MPTAGDSKVVMVAGTPVMLVWKLGMWLKPDLAPVPAIGVYRERTVIEEFSRKFPQRSAMQLVKRGGRRKLVRKSEYGKSLRKFYSELDKASALRVAYRNSKGCEQIDGPLTAVELPISVALEALGKALKAQCLHAKPCSFCS